MSRALYHAEVPERRLDLAEFPVKDRLAHQRQQLVADLHVLRRRRAVPDRSDHLGLNGWCGVIMVGMVVGVVVGMVGMALVAWWCGMVAWWHGGMVVWRWRCGRWCSCRLQAPISIQPDMQPLSAQYKYIPKKRKEKKRMPHGRTGLCEGSARGMTIGPRPTREIASSPK